MVTIQQKLRREVGRRFRITRYVLCGRNADQSDMAQFLTKNGRHTLARNISDWENGRSMLPNDVAAILYQHGILEDWLLKGEGAMQMFRGMLIDESEFLNPGGPATYDDLIESHLNLTAAFSSQGSANQRTLTTALNEVSATLSEVSNITARLERLQAFLIKRIGEDNV